MSDDQGELNFPSIESAQEADRERKRLKPLSQQQGVIWDDEQRAIPNELVRCALFSAQNRKSERRHLKEETMALVAGGSVKYTGEELRQIDLTVFLQMVHLGRNTVCGNKVRFKAHAFCKALGWGTSKENYARLRSCLTRMQACSLWVYSKRIRITNAISMIPDFGWQDAENESLTEYEVTMHPKLVDLFGGVYYTKIEWAQRVALPDGLATWLHCYFASHKQPFPISLEDVLTHCGSSAKEMRSFKQTVIKSLDNLKSVGFLQSWEIIDQKIHVVRS